MDRRNLLSTGMLLTLGGLMPAAEAAEAAPGTKHGLLLNSVSGNTLNRANQAGTFAGTILIKRLGFDSETRTLKIYGLVNGTATTGGRPRPSPTRSSPRSRTSPEKPPAAVGWQGCSIL